jgi:thioesterase domain-containing protein/aryl carrier-like protein
VLGDEKFTGDVTATRNWLQRLIAMTLRVSPNEVSSAESLGMFGIDSAQALSLTAPISRYIGSKFSPAMLYEHPTIDTLALYLCSRTGTEKRVLVQLQKGTPEKHPKLFCVHPAGGSVMAYLRLVAALPTDIPVYAFGNDEGEAPADDLVAMAKYYRTEMQAVQPNGPYYLLGYSFGGAVAYEMARQILADGGEVGSVVMIDTFAPLYQDNTPGPQLAETESYSHLLETAILNNLIPNHLDDEEREKFRQRIAQNQRAFARYRIEAPNDPAGNKTVQPQIKMLRASEEAPHLRDSARHAAFDHLDFGWEQAAPGSVVKVVKVPGDHFSIMNDPNQFVATLLDWLGSPLIVPSV